MRVDGGGIVEDFGNLQQKTNIHTNLRRCGSVVCRLTVKKLSLRIYINQGPVVVVAEGLQWHVAAYRENM